MINSLAKPEKKETQNNATLQKITSKGKKDFDGLSLA